MSAPLLFSKCRIGDAGFTSTYTEYDIEVVPVATTELTKISFDNDQEFAFKATSNIDVNVLNSSITSEAHVNTAIGNLSKLVLVGVSGAVTISMDNVQLTMFRDTSSDPIKYKVTGKASVANVGTTGQGAFAIS